MSQAEQTEKAKEATVPAPDKPQGEPAPVTIEHEIALAGRTLAYSTTTGRLPLNNEAGETEAHIFFMAYTRKDAGDPAQRPLIFVFNGGPGSASIWLHLGALGPKRVKMQDEGWMPAPPYQLVDNDHTWLDHADLVFVDPVGTGYSRAARPELNQKFWNVRGDIQSMGDFIRLYLTRYQRWQSPLFLAGESYGTTRAAGLAGHLIDRGVALNGILLISTILQFQTARFAQENNLPYTLFVPTYTATAWYHGKLPADLQARALRDVLAEVEAWVESEYAVALMQGDKLSGRNRQAMVRKLARYTGLSTRYIEQNRLNIHIMRFCKELLRDQGTTVGRLDSRFKGVDEDEANHIPAFDPSLTAIMPPYTATFNHYARTELQYETDLEYHALSFKVNEGWEYERGTVVDTSAGLRDALHKNPYMKVLVAQGYYDLATPHFAALYTLNHMNLNASLRDNIQVTYYEAGHMMYLDTTSLAQLTRDATAFILSAV